MSTPRRGDRFEHRRHLTTQGPRRAAVCVVTAVRNGVVYYHDEPDGMRCRAPLAPKPGVYRTGDAARDRVGYRGFEAEEVGRWLPREAS